LDLDLPALEISVSHLVKRRVSPRERIGQGLGLDDVQFSAQLLEQLLAALDALLKHYGLLHDIRDGREFFP